MAHKVLAIYASRCTGCRICEQWCAYQHHGAVSPAHARITVQQLHLRSAPIACNQCRRAPCIAACPSGAISRDPMSGGLQLDAEACVGCRLCLEACPRACIKMDAEVGVPLLCDLCGGEPQCARHCPEGAILCLELDLVDRAYRDDLVAGKEVL